MRGLFYDAKGALVAEHEVGPLPQRNYVLNQPERPAPVSSWNAADAPVPVSPLRVRRFVLVREVGDMCTYHEVQTAGRGSIIARATGEDELRERFVPGAAACREALERISLGHLPLEVECSLAVDYKEHPPRLLGVRLVLISRDRDDGAPGTRIAQVVPVTMESLPRLHLLLRAALAGMLVHELEEHFTLNGERVFDPHRGELP